MAVIILRFRWSGFKIETALGGGFLPGSGVSKNRTFGSSTGGPNSFSEVGVGES